MKIQNINIASIVQEQGTPCYLYDQEAIKQNYRALRDTFPSQVDIFYSLKANPTLAICAECKELGSGAEVSSVIELCAAIKVGFQPSNIIFVGPAKTEHDITQCLQHNIYAIVCESLYECTVIARIAKRMNKKARVAIRINPSFAVKMARLKMGGQAAQFGIDQEIFFSALDFLLAQDFVDIIGFHIYNGTRILEAEAIAENVSNIIQLMEKIIAYTQKTFELLDIGGGLGVPYFSGEKYLDLALLKKLIEPILMRFSQGYPKTRIILESGRFLLADAGFFVSRVLDKKVSRDKIFLITDGGTNCHMAAVGCGSLLHHNFPMRVIARHDHGDKQNECYTITGPLCTPGDVIGQQVNLPFTAIGDLVVVERSGAYGLTASPGLFLSHGFPCEVLIKNKTAYLIRSKYELQDFFNQQRFPL